MSFKRDGDDTCALENLRKRRVSDLLFEDIQDGEVSKLRNGRYLCKICPHCPTFDTLNMFQVHKQGKKHLKSVQYKEMKNLELQELIQKREHEQVSSGSQENVPKLLGPATSSISSKPKPYDPRAQRNKAKPFDRRPVVDLHDHTETFTNIHVSTTCLNSLPGNREKTDRSAQSYRQEICKGEINTSASKTCTDLSSGNIPIALTKQKDNTFQKPSRNITNLYKQSSFTGEKDNEPIKPSTISKLIGSEPRQSCTQHYFARKQKLQGVGDTTELSTIKPLQKQDFSKSWEYYKDRSASRLVIPQKAFKESEKNPLKESQDAQSKAIGTQHDSFTVEQEASSTVSSPKDQGRAEQMLKAFGSGWKKDWTGKWIKDEDAEFDSDEEPPEIT